MDLTKTTRALATAAALVAGTAAACGAYAVLVEPRWFALRRFSLPVLPAGSAPLNVLHISDLHLLPGQRAKRRWVAQLAELDPDLVISTGDNIAAAESIPVVHEVLAKLMRKPGAFVFGSNDYFAPTFKNPLRYFSGPSKGPAAEDHLNRALPVDDLRRRFTDAGWLDLNNSAGELTIGELKISFAGVDDPHLDYDRLANAARLDAGAGLRIGLAHAPYQRVLDAFADAGADVILAGHTHGGQIRIPFWGAPVTNCDLDHAHARGTFRWRGARVHISAGLGASPYAPVRFSCRPEASLITLRPVRAA